MLIYYLSALDTEEDKNKFEKLYIAYKQAMYYSAYRILSNVTQSEDAVHQAFIRIIDQFSHVGDIDSVQTKSFCVIICRNIAIDMYRKDKKRSLFSLVETDIPDKKEMDTSVLSDMNVEEITACIMRLPDIYKDVLMLTSGNGYRPKQIAKALHISHENAKKRIQRARIILQQELRKEHLNEWH